MKSTNRFVAMGLGRDADDRGIDARWIQRLSKHTCAEGLDLEMTANKIGFMYHFDNIREMKRERVWLLLQLGSIFSSIEEIQKVNIFKIIII